MGPRVTRNATEKAGREGSSSSKFIRNDYSPWTALDVVRVSTRAVIRYLWRVGGQEGGKWGRGAGGLLSFIRPRTAMQSSDVSYHIPHTCHCLYHIPFTPCCRWRISTSRCRVLHHRGLTFPHIPPPQSSPRLHQSQPSLRLCHGHCHSRRSLRFLLCHNFACCRQRGFQSCFHLYCSCSTGVCRRLSSFHVFTVRLTPATSSASLTTCILLVFLPTSSPFPLHDLLFTVRCPLSAPWYSSPYPGRRRC